jgi:hypothetical protein
MDIPYYEDIKILGLQIKRTRQETAKTCWNSLTARIRTNASWKRAYG